MYDKNNIFAKILNGEIPYDKVYEDEIILAFKDKNPAASIHIVVICKEGYISFDDFSQKANIEYIGSFFKSLHKVIDKLNLANSGYRLITNHGQNASQTIPHFHIHILAGEKLSKMN